MPLSDLIRRVTSGIEDKYHNQPSADSLSTGFRSLDDMTGGSHRGDLVVVLADTPDIATAFLLSSVHSRVSWDCVPAVFVSAHHDENYVVTKLLSIESGIREIELRSAMLDTVHRSALTASANALYDTATNHDRPIVVSSRATPEQWDERRFDRWFDTILRLTPAEVDTDLIQVDVLQSRHGETLRRLGGGVQ